jgi:hypothetical protein
LALADEIRAVVHAAELEAEGYRLTRHNYFLGHRLRFGGVGSDQIVRLFLRTKGKYRPVRVHESILVEGRIGELRAPLEHYSYTSLHEYVAKANHYTDLAAEELRSRGRRFALTDHLRPVWELFSRLVMKSAWLDGMPGIMYAMLSAHTAWLRSAKLWALEHHRPAQPSERSGQNASA